MVTPSDLFLSPDLSEEDARDYLRSLGFRDAEATERHLQEIAGDVVIREALGRIAGELLPALLESPNPDEAVIGLSQYLAVRTGRAMFLDYLAEDPRALHVLSWVFGSSPLLSDILIHNPEYFHWLVAQIERSAPDRQDLEDDLDTMVPHSAGHAETIENIKRWKWREILRVGTSDLLRRETVPSISGQLSDLADVIVNRVMALTTRANDNVGDPGTFAVIALGELGGREMSYASPVELLCVFDAAADRDGDARGYFQEQAARLASLLCGADVDPLYSTTEIVFQSLRDSRDGHSPADAAVDRRMLVKARPIAGDAELGRRFVDIVRPLVFQGNPDAKAARYALDLTADLKEDPGDMVRCVEACVQALQLAHGARYHSLQQTGTLDALSAMATEGVIAGEDKRELAHAYEFLKGVAHTRQLMPGDSSPASENLEKQVRTYHPKVDEICRRLCSGLAV